MVLYLFNEENQAAVDLSRKLGQAKPNALIPCLTRELEAFKTFVRVEMPDPVDPPPVKDVPPEIIEPPVVVQKPVVEKKTGRFERNK